MLNQLKRLIQRYRIWQIEWELRALEKYGNVADPKIRELIQHARQIIVRERAGRR